MSEATKNWKTTVGGILMAVGGPLATAGEGLYQTIGTILLAVGGLLVGVAATDAKKA